MHKLRNEKIILRYTDIASIFFLSSQQIKKSCDDSHITEPRRGELPFNYCKVLVKILVYTCEKYVSSYT